MRRRDIEVRARRYALIIGAVAAFASLAAVAGCSAGAREKTTTRQLSAAHKASPGATKSPAAKPTPTAKPAPPEPEPSALPVGPANAGALPQTGALPRTTSTDFNNAIHDIWLAVTTGNPDYARPAFFPEKSYAQIKAIADPESDWENRLWYDFTLDLADVHQLVGKHATLTSVVTPTLFEQWIPAGACYNSTGYWHLPGARLVYREDGVTHSFGMASFISWRGDWYLIHLGALVRSGAYGIVDDPETGAGVPGPPGGC